MTRYIRLHIGLDEVDRFQTQSIVRIGHMKNNSTYNARIELSNGTVTYVKENPNTIEAAIRYAEAKSTHG